MNRMLIQMHVNINLEFQRFISQESLCISLRKILFFFLAYMVSILVSNYPCE